MNGKNSFVGEGGLKPSQAAKPPPPPPRKLRRPIFHMVKGNVRVAGAVATRQMEGGGRGDLGIDNIR